jgi:hypothetical protein
MTLTLDPAAPAWAQRFRLEIEAQQARQDFPTAPTRLAVFATAADLPSVTRWRNTVAICSDTGAGSAALVWCDGAAWYPLAQGSAL